MTTYLPGSPSEISFCNDMLRYANVLIVTAHLHLFDMERQAVFMYLDDSCDRGGFCFPDHDYSVW